MILAALSSGLYVVLREVFHAELGLSLVVLTAPQARALSWSRILDARLSAAVSAMASLEGSVARQGCQEVQVLGASQVSALGRFRSIGCSVCEVSGPFF